MKTAPFLAILLTLFALYGAITATPTTEAASTTRHRHAAPINLHSLSLFPAAGHTMYLDYKQIVVESKFNFRKARMCWAAIHNMDFYYCRADIHQSFLNNKICMSDICCDAITGFQEACSFYKNPFLAEFVKLHCSRPDDNVVSPPTS